MCQLYIYHAVLIAKNFKSLRGGIEFLPPYTSGPHWQPYWHDWYNDRIVNATGQLEGMILLLFPFLFPFMAVWRGLRKNGWKLVATPGKGYRFSKKGLTNPREAQTWFVRGQRLASHRLNQQLVEVYPGVLHWSWGLTGRLVRPMSMVRLVWSVTTSTPSFVRFIK